MNELKKVIKDLDAEVESMTLMNRKTVKTEYIQKYLSNIKNTLEAMPASFPEIVQVKSEWFFIHATKPEPKKLYLVLFPHLPRPQMAYYDYYNNKWFFDDKTWNVKDEQMAMEIDVPNYQPRLILLPKTGS